MIKFFRKIRQELLARNKLRRYLLYAVGEIFLVVVGILIALQINNWNEERKAKEIEAKFLKELKVSLVTNKINFKKRASYFKRRHKQLNLLEKHLLQKKPYNDTLQKDFFLIVNDYSFGVSYSTYEDLKSQGLTNITNDSIRKQTIRLYDERFGVLSSLETKWNYIFGNTIIGVVNENFRITPMGHEPNNYKKLIESENYSNIVSMVSNITRRWSKLSEATIGEIDKLIALIDKEKK